MDSDSSSKGPGLRIQGHVQAEKEPAGVESAGSAPISESVGRRVSRVPADACAVAAALFAPTPLILTGPGLPSPLACWHPRSPLVPALSRRHFPPGQQTGTRMVPPLCRARARQSRTAKLAGKRVSVRGRFSAASTECKKKQHTGPNSESSSSRLFPAPQSPQQRCSSWLGSCAMVICVAV